MPTAHSPIIAFFPLVEKGGGRSSASGKPGGRSAEAF